MEDMQGKRQISLIAPDLLPTTEKARTISFLDFTLIWAGMSIDISSFAIGAQLYPGIDPWGIVWACVLAYAMVIALLTLTGDIGITYGIPYPVYIRACFGYLGTRIPAVMRGIPCWFWFGFQTWLAGYAINQILIILFDYSNLWLTVAVFGIAQVANAAFGIKAMAKFDWVAIPVLTVIFCSILAWLMVSHGATPARIMAAPAENTMAFPIAVVGLAGGYITMAINFMDITKNIKRDKNYREQSFLKRNRYVVIGSCIGLIGVGLIFLLMGTVSQILTGIWNPIDILTESFRNQHLLLIVCIIAILFAQWSTNTAANLLPGGYIISSLFPKHVNFSIGVVISGVISVLMMPWKFADQLVYFGFYCCVILGPVAGVIISDYYLLRKRKLNIRELYKSGGQYTYYKNYNPAAVITVLVSIPFSFLNHDFAFFIGFGISLVLYYILMKYWIVKKYPQAELDESFVPDEFNPDQWPKE